MDLGNKKVLITGITGCVGSRLCDIALSRGLRVAGLVRNPEQAQRLRQSKGIETFLGDITDLQSAETACRGCDFVVHSAAIVKERGPLEEFRRVNVGGTRNMLSAARKAGVRSFVQISSVAVYGFTYPDNVTEEGAVYSGTNPYCLTKVESEQEALKWNSPGAFGVIALRAGDVYGPNCQPWVIRPLQMMRAGTFVLMSGGRGVMNHVYVDNLVDAVWLAIEREAYGESFNITDGCQTSWKDYYTQLAAIGGLPPPRLSLPIGLCKFAALVWPWGPASPELIDMTTRRFAYSIEKAKRRLGYLPRVELSEGMQKTKAWLNVNQV